MRPTTDRARESVFAVIAAHLGTADGPPEAQLAGLRFLDLYAGSGAVGLEAASRGASATWVEADPAVARLIMANCRELGLVPDVVTATVENWLTQPVRRRGAGGAGTAGYDIVWLDPPYDCSTDHVGDVIAVAVQRDWVRPGGLILAERSARSPALEFPENLLNNGTRRYGETVVYLAQKAVA